MNQNRSKRITYSESHVETKKQCEVVTSTKVGEAEGIEESDIFREIHDCLLQSRLLLGKAREFFSSKRGGTRHGKE